jgi:DnaJ domain
MQAAMGPWFGSKGAFAGSRKSPGQKSTARTDALEMELDRDTGHMDGQCLKGQFAGRALSSLSHAELLLLREELRTADSQDAFLIEAYLDRRRGATPGTIPMAALLAIGTLLLLIFGRRLGASTGSWFGVKGPFGTSRKSPGQKSEVRTESLKMELDHDSGQMEGECLKGQFAGKALSSLCYDDLLQLLEELRATDHQGALLIEAYLDRRSPGWRVQGSDDAARHKPKQPRASHGRMTIEEAYEVLGLEANARETEIRAAHRGLMMKLHPDRGGTTYFACRINEAKDILLGHT